MMVDFFGTTPGLLSLAGLAGILILVSVVRRLAARARARREGAGAGSTDVRPASPDFTPDGTGAPPRWLIAAIAAWAAAADSEAPSAEAWKPVHEAQDPWLAAGWRNVGVTK